jgi:hypothetical protein
MVLATYSLCYRGMPCNLQTFDRGLRMPDSDAINIIMKLSNEVGTPALYLVVSNDRE